MADTSVLCWHLHLVLIALGVACTFIVDQIQYSTVCSVVTVSIIVVLKVD